MRPFRVPIDSDLTPEAAVAWLRGEDRPFALIGEWLGGLTMLGSHPARVATPSDDPFALLEDQPELSESGEAVVGGGWVGWLGYGLGSIVEQLPPSPPAPIPCPSSSLAFYDHVVVHDGERWWFEGLWSSERAAALEERLAVWKRRLKPGQAPPLSDSVPEPFVLAASAGAGHLDAVADCVHRIETGELYQANLCVRLEARYDGDPLDLFARAAPLARPRFGALVGGVVSLSPERFLRRCGREVWTEPIKGTRPRTGSDDDRQAAREALLASTKDAAEHVMIVDLMRNDLGRVCAYGTVVAHEPRIEPHAGVWHLVSTVTGRLRDGVRDGELLRATFPPGSVTGAPKVQAMKVIATLEATRREVYTGAIGIASPIAGLDTSVVIRTFETAGDTVWMGVGGAIVADSDPEQELEEALTKAAGPIAAIGGSLARPLERPAAYPPELCVYPGHAVERALLHGQRPDPALGVFETVLVEEGRPVALERHLARLAASVAEVYGSALPSTVLAGAQAAAAEAVGRSRMRVLADADGAVRITVSPAGAPPAGTVVLEPFALPGGLGAHKWRDRRLLDALAAVRPGTVPLLVDTDGLVLEAAYANVWIVEDDDLITPPADGRMLPGTTRAALLRAHDGAREEPIDLDRLASADAVFLTSSISGRVPARLRRPVLVPVPVAAMNTAWTPWITSARAPALR
ncbi:MAG TPA: bifunctional anthranilate synthase component I family protein/class IV aminotransferase [Solirubrobacteraceae bacterium]|nr:bifunctional anthranilate synthase component I family protein/class IV aminotransferase [Solirubrobacteraceae bacterium]